MKQYPPIPPLDDAPDGLLDSGHLWLLEHIDGAQLRFRLRESGLVEFGDRERVYGAAENLPDTYRHAVRHVRENLDRDALRDAVDDPASVVFFGEATSYHTLDYDWERTPSLLGFDVWTAETGFRPPDAVERIFETFGLHPVNAVAREVNTRDFDPESYAMPESAWRDGPPAGVVVRNKRGQRAKLVHPDFEARSPPAAAEGTPAELAARTATPERFEKLDSGADAVSVDELVERALADIFRTEHARLRRLEGVDLSTFRSEVASLARAFRRDSG